LKELNHDALIEACPEALVVQEKQLRRSALSCRVRLLELLKSGDRWGLARAAKQLASSLRQAQRWFKRHQ
jgi:hypothetical protein